MWNADLIGYRGSTAFNRAYEGDELVWEKQHPIPEPTDEIWYFSNAIAYPYKQDFSTYNANIVSNTFSDGKGTIKFDRDVTRIGKDAFRNCTTINSYVLPNTATLIGETVFNQNLRLGSITIPDSVTDIGNYAFSNCGSLTTLTFGSGIKNIGEMLFINCSQLRYISYNGTKALWNAVNKGERWNYNAPATVVHCSDGDVPI